MWIRIAFCHEVFKMFSYTGYNCCMGTDVPIQFFAYLCAQRFISCYRSYCVAAGLMTLIDCYNLEIGWRMVGGPGFVGF